jgi:hypothetical protein
MCLGYELISRSAVTESGVRKQIHRTRNKRSSWNSVCSVVKANGVIATFCGTAQSQRLPGKVLEG